MQLVPYPLDRNVAIHILNLDSNNTGIDHTLMHMVIAISLYRDENVRMSTNTRLPEGSFSYDLKWLVSDSWSNSSRYY